jgi:DNA polymerase eta
VLKQKLGEANAVWVHDISRGICNELVQPAALQKSFGCNKSFRPFIKDPNEVLSWVDVLSSELFVRLKDEYEESSRWPKTIQVNFRQENESPQSRSAPLPSRQRILSPENISEIIWKLISTKPITP